jgi:Tfp pilus assembly protein PilF
MCRFVGLFLQSIGSVVILLMAGCHCANGWVMNNSGMGYYQKGNYSMARGEFQRAVVDAPRNADYRHNLAMAMQKQGDVAAAETVLRHNLSVDPMHQPTYHALSQILVSQQRTAEADALLTGWQESQPYVPEAYIEHAWLQRETGNKAAAEQSLRQALQVKPNHPVALAHLGQLSQETGQADQAAGYYQRSLLARWNQPQVHSRLSSLTGTTSTAMNMRRSAMVYNEPMIAANPMPVVDGITVTQSGLPGGGVMAFEDSRRVRRFNRHRHLRDDGAEVAAYPLPSYGLADATVVQPGIVTAVDPDGLPSIASPTILPDMASQPTLAAPAVAATPTPLSQADPAHATEIAAGIPVVDPH